MRICLAIIYLLCAIIIYSQTVDSLAGEYWNSLSDNEKVSFIIGITQGQASIIFIFDEANDVQFAEALRDYADPEITINEAIKRIDLFYMLEVHKNIPIWVALLVVSGKLKLKDKEA